MSMLEIKSLYVSIGNKKILKGVDLTTNTGEIHVIMGLNRTDKSILSVAIIGNPGYEITEGEILFDDVNVLDLEIDERACSSLSLAMQYPSETPGTTNAEFMRVAINAKCDEDDRMSIIQFLEKLDNKMELLNMPEETAECYLSEGFSGGEKKRNGVLQLLILEPTFVILDEIDSGLDIDMLEVVPKGVNEMRGENSGALIITHYQHLLNYITPDVVHIVMEDHVVKTDGADSARRLGTEDYVNISQGLGIDYKGEA